MSPLDVMKLSTLAPLGLVSLSLILFGCSEEKVIPVEPDYMTVSENKSGDARFAWEQSPRRYRVINLNQTATAKTQKREAWIVYEYPETKAEVREAAAEVYDELWIDINSAGGADLEQITVLVFCCEEDAEANSGFEIFCAKGGGLNVDPLPMFDQATYKWQWRDPEHRPDDQAMKIFNEYWVGRSGLEEDGSEEERRLVASLANTHKVTTREVAQAVAAGWVWRQTHKKPYSEAGLVFHTTKFADSWRLDEPIDLSAPLPDRNGSQRLKARSFEDRLKRNSEIDVRDDDFYDDGS